jgi:hypothetical protein
MKTKDKRGDIHKNFFCSTAGISDCPEKGNCALCQDCHRKWPTPEMFHQEYGVTYPNEAAVFFKRHNDTQWAVGVWDTVKKFNPVDYLVVCACTPWGKPPKDWERV